jgi:tetratricopeptide (TPR) repeat protein
MWRRTLIIGAIVVGLFVTGYVLAWYNAYRLSSRFLAEAEAAYARGAYLHAFMGYEEILPEANQRVRRGGYYQVANVWRDPYAWPRPAFVAQANTCIQAILWDHLTIEDGERFVRENAGLPNPYFADVYLRLGELYETDGDHRSAIEIYRDIPQLFRNRPDLIARANQRLVQLGLQR